MPDRSARIERRCQSADPISQHCPKKDTCFVAVDLERRENKKITKLDELLSSPQLEERGKKSFLVQYESSAVICFYYHNW